jgi:hypothetical protein
VRVRYVHPIFTMKTVKKVMIFLDKQFIIVDEVRGLILKKEYQKYTFTITQSLKDQFLEYKLKYKRVKEKRTQITDKEKKDYLLTSLSDFKLNVKIAKKFI